MHDIDWGVVVSALAGGGAAGALARVMVARALTNLDDLTRKLNDVLIRLSAINVKLEAVDRLRQTVAEHDRSIAVLDARSQLNGEFTAARRPPSNRPS